ncbi:hypothetical protein M5K25_006142 [Dendrobium thyrsiflorum]|uniref:Uncharacterized protein n=1 Tax=Dendrobium thyrsiflorum TaxID=117978 RepID=A0ABD0VBT1_DENTH
MEEQMRLYIRLAMEDSGFHLHTSMDNNMYNLINVTRFPPFDTSARMSFPRAQAPVVNYILDLSLKTLSIKDFILFSRKIWCRRENLSFPNPRSSIFNLAPSDHLSFRLLVRQTATKVEEKVKKKEKEKKEEGKTLTLQAKGGNEPDRAKGLRPRLGSCKRGDGMVGGFGLTWIREQQPGGSFVGLGFGRGGPRGELWLSLSVRELQRREGEKSVGWGSCEQEATGRRGARPFSWFGFCELEAEEGSWEFGFWCSGSPTGSERAAVRELECEDIPSSSATHTRK